MMHQSSNMKYIFTPFPITMVIPEFTVFLKTEVAYLTNVGTQWA